VGLLGSSGALGVTLAPGLLKLRKSTANNCAAAMRKKSLKVV